MNCIHKVISGNIIANQLIRFVNNTISNFSKNGDFMTQFFTNYSRFK